MSPIDIWFKHLESLCEEYNKILLTEHEFADALKSLILHPHSPLEAVSYQITCTPPFDSITIGNTLPGEPTDIHPYALRDQHVKGCRIRLWRKAIVTGQTLHVDSALLNKYLSSFIDCFWKPAIRDDLTGLASAQSSGINQILDSAVVRFVQNYNVLCTIFCDIDNFKQVNDTLGMPIGDKTIVHFAALFDRAVRPDGVVLRRSAGADEFIILLPSENSDKALSLIYDAMRALAEYDFDIGGIKIGVSAGISVLGRDSEPVSYKELEKRAEKALKPSPGIKNKNRATFESKIEVGLQLQNKFSRDLAFCIIKSSLDSPRPFESPWLNMVSRHVCGLLQAKEWKNEEVKVAIKNIIDWMKPNFKKDVMRAASPPDTPGDFSSVFSPIDVALATAHGVFRAGLLNNKLKVGDLSLNILYSEDLSACELRLMPDDLILMKYGGTVKPLSNVWNLGGFFYLSSDGLIDRITTRRALLVKIGHSILKLPASIFAEVIIVDDRPTRGGGLHDFWEATIARLAARVEADSNIAAVYVLGNHSYGAQTISKLRNLHAWKLNADQIAYKTGMSVQSIHIAVDRLDGKVFFPDNEEELISTLADLLLNSYNLNPITQPTISQRERRFLTLELSMDNMALGRKDGCRVKTIAEAYPVVLEIARKVTDEEKIIDQAGQELRELIDFKVHLTNPSQDRVPAFYEQEKDSLEEYFNREFLNDSGFFRKRLKDTKQLEAVLNHLATAIGNPTRQFATRRAILVVPHDIKNGEDLSPLGLVSIRIVPRFIQTRIRLHFSYTWRTVEALVGFPYSLYGSVRYSQYLTDEIKKRLSPEYARQCEMGEVSYIAHSLHIFMDDYGQNIARRIVDDASI